uniref:Uncharacterized protein n=1 Tax=Aegilops tauschii subsp. strangulata TaxID=200361 RepID=A0A453DA11_AEGTS
RLWRRLGLPRQEQQQRHIGTTAHLAAGGFAGVVSKTCTTPLARLTILFQVAGMHSDAAALRKCSIWHEASRIVWGVLERQSCHHCTSITLFRHELLFL